MTGTRENILHTALRLFARYGYEGVSVSTIAGELGMTKGALYRHYKNKRDIFDSIVKRMCRMDIERARRHEVPQETFDREPQAYRGASADRIRDFIEAQFHFWTADEFACNFRRMLALEQYGNPEMAALYRQIMTGGPVSYMEDLFREMMEEGALKRDDPGQLALEFHASFYLLMALSDASADPAEKRKIAARFTAHIERFLERYATHRNKQRHPADL